MLFRETVAVYCEKHMEHTNTLWVGVRACVRARRMQGFSVLKHVVCIVTAGL
jgi:hypothetical protein